MADSDRTTSDRLTLYRELQESPYSFDFFHALRRVECANPDKARIGRSVKPADDAIRLGQEPSMAFAPSTLTAFQLNEDLPPRLDVLFFGVFGPNGPLPLHLTEYARDRMRNHADRGFARFADIFHHRLMSLFYRAWSDAQAVTSMDRPQDDSFTRRLACLAGIGNEVSQNPETPPDFAKLFYGGHFACQSKNAEGLLAILRNYFDIAIELQEFVGQWMEIEAEDRLYLDENGSFGNLGVDTILGEKVWECQSKFRLVCGPLTLENFNRMLPGSQTLSRFVTTVRNYIGFEMDWDIRLILQKDEMQPACLGTFGQLGWTTWLTTDYPQCDFSDLLINPGQEII